MVKEPRLVYLPKTDGAGGEEQMDLRVFLRHQHKIKCKQLRPGYEVGSPISLYIYIYIYKTKSDKMNESDNKDRNISEG